MHSRPAGPRPWQSRSAAVLFAATAACSSLPPPSYPPHADHDLLVTYVVPADGRLAMPTSTATRVVWQLAAEPAPAGEEFAADGVRQWLFPAGAEVHVRCRCRLYREGDLPPDPATLFPGARSVRHSADAETRP